jgi:hypothetical protein
MIKVEELTTSLQTALSQDALKRKSLKGKQLDFNAEPTIFEYTPVTQ